MRQHGLAMIERAVQTTQVWLSDVAKEFGTDDQRFAYRVTRAWLHTLRDRLSPEVGAHFAAGLPELLRGLYYDGWDPARVPARYRVEEYRQRFAAAAGIPASEVTGAARKVTTALAGHLAAGQLEHALSQLPERMRELIDPRAARRPATAPERPAPAPDELAPTPALPATAPIRPVTGGPNGAGPTGQRTERRLARLEATVEVLKEALGTLSTGLQTTPTTEPDSDRGPRAARLAHEMLMTTPGDSF